MASFTVSPLKYFSAIRYLFTIADYTYYRLFCLRKEIIDKRVHILFQQTPSIHHPFLQASMDRFPRPWYTKKN
jgi:hypothetical protein